MKKKCWRCGNKTEDWEIVNGGLPNCWPCGKIIREEHAKALKKIEKAAQKAAAQKVATENRSKGRKP